MRPPQLPLAVSLLAAAAAVCAGPTPPAVPPLPGSGSGSSSSSTSGSASAAAGSTASGSAASGSAASGSAGGSSASSSASGGSDCGSGSGQQHTAERIRTVSMGASILVVVISAAFELSKHSIEHHCPAHLQHLLHALFGEFTVLGFISLVLFMIEMGGAITDVSVKIFDGDKFELIHLIHVAHLILFCIMMMYLFTVCVMVFAGRFMQKCWRRWEDELLDKWEAERRRDSSIVPEVTFDGFARWSPWWWGDTARATFVSVRSQQLRSLRQAKESLPAAGEADSWQNALEISAGVERDHPPLRFHSPCAPLGQLSNSYAPSVFFTGERQWMSVEQWCTSQAPADAPAAGAAAPPAPARSGAPAWCDDSEKAAEPDAARAGSGERPSMSDAPLLHNDAQQNPLRPGGAAPAPVRDDVGEARSGGGELQIRAMFQGIKAKFEQATHCQQILLNTGQRYLLSGESEGSAAWQNRVIRDSSEPQGWNTLGKLLMHRRRQLQVARGARHSIDEHFDFGEYQSVCLGMTLEELAHLPATIWLVISAIVIIWWLFSWQLDTGIQVITWFLVGICQVLFLWALVVHLRSLVMKVSPRILVGEDVSPEQWEWQRRLFFCGGPRAAMYITRLCVFFNAAHFSMFLCVYMPYTNDSGSGPGVPTEYFDTGVGWLILWAEVVLFFSSTCVLLPSAVIALCKATSVGAMRRTTAVHTIQSQWRIRRFILSMRLVCFLRDMGDPVKGGKSIKVPGGSAQIREGGTGWAREWQTWQSILDDFDVDGTGHINTGELLHRLTMCLSDPMSEAQTVGIKEKLEGVSVDGTGTFSAEQFESFVLANRINHIGMAELDAVFDLLAQGDSRISFEEFSQIACHFSHSTMHAVDAEDVIATLYDNDRNGDRSFDRREFAGLCRAMGVMGTNLWSSVDPPDWCPPPKPPARIKPAVHGWFAPPDPSNPAESWFLGRGPSFVGGLPGAAGGLGLGRQRSPNGRAAMSPIGRPVTSPDHAPDPEHP